MNFRQLCLLDKGAFLSFPPQGARLLLGETHLPFLLGPQQLVGRALSSTVSACRPVDVSRVGVEVSATLYVRDSKALAYLTLPIAFERGHSLSFQN